MARPFWSWAKMIPEKVKEFEWYFSIWLTDDESCLMADVSRETLNKYCQANEWWREKKELLKRKPLIKAKSNLVKELNWHNIDVSKWYAERKGKDEFSLKQEIDTKVEVTWNINIALLTPQQRLEYIKEQCD